MACEPHLHIHGSHAHLHIRDLICIFMAAALICISVSHPPQLLSFACPQLICIQDSELHGFTLICILNPHLHTPGLLDSHCLPASAGPVRHLHKSACILTPPRKLRPPRPPPRGRW